ncbi:MAG: dihydrofolate reductase [Bacteroidales bacterium]|jgi:dihydrofolate reductase|nr:dihydrofolate reductase [Bacteroidales bacterium]
MKQISIIVAIAQNNAIGKNNDLLWHISDDLKRFKKITLNHTVVMGRNTFYSLPVRPFPLRRNVVMTNDKSVKIEGCEMAYSIQEAIDLCDADGESFICGGGAIYQQFLPLADKLYLTVVHQDFEADTFFPEINYNEWKLVEESERMIDEKTQLPYSYLVYERQ